jgi:hypothetical protein
MSVMPKGGYREQKTELRRYLSSRIRANAIAKQSVSHDQKRKKIGRAFHAGRSLHMVS